MSSPDLLGLPPPTTTPLPLPCTSRAATLSPELLAQIFKDAVRRHDSCGKVTLGLVCRSWWQASNPWTGYQVLSVSQAERLAIWLEKKGKGGAVRLLFVEYDNTDEQEVGALASLLRTCTNLEELCLAPYVEEENVLQWLCDDSDEVLIQALESLKQLREPQTLEVIKLPERLKAWWFGGANGDGSQRRALNTAAERVDVEIEFE